MKRYLYLVAGIILILISIAGLFLPLLQGILMILAGLVLIGEYKEIPFIERMKEKLKKKWEETQKERKRKKK